MDILKMILFCHHLKWLIPFSYVRTKNFLNYRHGDLSALQNVTVLVISI